MPYETISQAGGVRPLRSTTRGQQIKILWTRTLISSNIKTTDS